MSTVTAKQSEEVPMFEAKQQKRGIGILELLGPQGRVELPLAKVGISAKVSSFVAEVSVQQTFQNPSSEALEAEYVFPLAGGCAVGHFELRVAGRVIVGKVQERGEARREYQKAIAEGKRAALLEQERSNVFTVKVGNLPPGEEATVQITYSERLSFFEDGSGELRLPLVVAPRYMAGGELSPPRLAPGFESKVGLQIDVELMREQGESGEAEGFDELACSQHATRTAVGKSSIRVQLARAEKLDRDFVLRWRMGGAQVTSSMQVYTPGTNAQKDKVAGFALVTLVPPRREGFLGMPREVVFVVDRSGSMEGVKMTSASTACALLLRTLGPRDRFAVQAFDNVCDWMDGGKFLAADEAGIEKGEQFLRGISARGGTELDLAMSEAIAALTKRKMSEQPGGLPIVVLLTDGQVGDESSVLKRLQTSLDDVRVFTVGIDSAVNDGFLRRLSAIGGGTATFVEPGAALEEALRAVGREIGAPLITDLKIADAGSGLELATLAPHEIPDLFEGRPASVFVRVKHAKALTLSGKYVDGSKFKQSVKAQEMGLPALAQLWAKVRVTELEDRFRLAKAGFGKESADELRQEIIELSCEHTLLTRFTAFLAVDQEIVNPGGEQKKLLQPVEMPADWSMNADLAAPMPAMASMGGAPAPMAPPPPSGRLDSITLGARSPLTLGRPMSPAAAPAKKQAEAGLLSTVAKAFSGKGSSRVRGMKEDEADRVDAAPLVAPETVASLKAALVRLSAALVEVQRELAAGKLPSHLELEAARDGLLKLLATFAEAASFPLLQRFLRTAAAELVAALRSQANAKSLEPLAARHLATFLAARAEADAALAKLGGQPAAPWETSI